MQGTVPQWAALSAARTRRRALAKRPSASAGVIPRASATSCNGTPWTSCMSRTSRSRGAGQPTNSSSSATSSRFPRAIDGAAEDLRILRIFQLMRLPKVVVVFIERVGLYLLGEQLGRHPAALVFARSQRFCCAEDQGQREGFDAERRGQTPALAPHAL